MENETLILALRLIERGGMVKRYHALPAITTETVGHHSFMVAWLCAMLSSVPPSASLLMAALQHDLAEYVTGDIPSPAKRKLDIREQFAAYEADIVQEHGHVDWAGTLTPEEARTLQFADNAAGLLHCLHERKLGNLYAAQTASRYRSYLDKLTPRTPTETVFLQLIDQRMRQL